MPLYRALLLLYPSSWREEYGDEMRAVFQARRRSASNPAAVLVLWLETIADLLTGAAGVQFDVLRQDLKYAARTFARSPGFVATSIGIAAIGIGATTAAFTMVDHVLIEPLPFRDPGRLVKIYEDHSAQGARFFDSSPANFHDWQTMSTSFESMGAYRGLSMNMTGQGDPVMLEGASVTAELFPILGTQPELGRVFTREDDQESSPGTVVLSYGLWQSYFAGDPGVLGKTTRLYDTPYTIIGVMPRTFYFPNRSARLWTAMRFGPADFLDRLDTYIYGIGRLKRDIPLQRAQAELRTVAAQISLAHPKEMAKTSAAAVGLHDDIPAQALTMLRVLLGAAACVLLIACTNLANLLLARAMVRRREVAVRTALGAGRERLIRQMLTESVLLAAAGGALGLAMAYAALPLLARLVPVLLPIEEVPPINGWVLLFAATVTAVTGIGFGVAPALRMFRSQDGTDLQQGGRSATGGRHETFRSALVIAEVAGSVVLLVGAGLFLRALLRIQAVDPGFRTDHILTLRTALPVPRYEKSTTREPFYRRVLGETQRLPGVKSAAYISFLPMVLRGGVWPIEAEGKPEEQSRRRFASLRFVTPGFFSTMSIPLAAGRDVDESDTNDRPYVALVSESFVRRYWPEGNPVGKRFDVGNHLRTVIGVVGDVRVRGLERSSEPQAYVPWKQADNVSAWYAPKDLVVRTTVEPTTLAPALRRIIDEADPSLPVSDVRPLTAIVEEETAPRRLQLWVLGAFGAAAFLLAAVGIHGLLSFAVASRTQEIGVRMALGAGRGNIMSMTMGDGLRLAVIGIVVGFGAAYAAGRLIESLLAGVKPDDWVTFGAAGALALVMTLAGSLLPALRAVRIDPIQAIRTE
jgi:predicted permease